MNKQVTANWDRPPMFKCNFYEAGRVGQEKHKHDENQCDLHTVFFWQVDYEFFSIRQLIKYLLAWWQKVEKDHSFNFIVRSDAV